MKDLALDSKIVIDYFENFSKKDLVSLEKQLDENVALQDWILKVNGKAKVLDAFKSIFEQNESILINPINIISSHSYYAAEISITINNDEVIDVVDIIKLHDNKIISIKAYKC